MRNEDMDEFVERVRSQSDILTVVSAYVPMKKKGNRYWGCCPFHQEKTPSFSVVPDKGFFYCFGCHVGGNVFKFLSLVENVSYFEAIKLQAVGFIFLFFAAGLSMVLGNRMNDYFSVASVVQFCGCIHI